MRPLLIILALLSAACAPAPQKRILEEGETAPTRSAFFSQNPKALQKAFDDGCQDPGDRLVTVSAQTRRCEILPPPELAAFLILEFDGALEVPLLILQKTTSRISADDDTQNFRVDMTYFAQVPKKNGNRQRVYFTSNDLNRTVDTLLVATGGRLVTE